MYRELMGEMVKHGITRKVLANRLGITSKTLFNKINGVTDFTWEEVKKIRDIVAPNKTLEELFEKREFRN